MDPERGARQVRRELIAVVSLAAVAAVTFLGTRTVASWERRVTLADASAWYSRGAAEMDAGRAEAAVESLRRAHSKNAASREYSVAFAHALSAAGRADDADRVLVQLRERSPEDPQLNLALARLAAARQDVGAAVRYFHSALYGVWPDGQGADRRAARVELVRLLLRHSERDQAVAELVALATNLPDAAAERTEAGQLMLEAGEPQRALDQFRRGLALDATYAAALAGAGESSFMLGDYAGARRYLLRVPQPSPRLVELRELAALVLERDPLAAKLTWAERRRRLRDLVVQEAARIDACRTRVPSVEPAASASRLDAAQQELAALEARDSERNARTANESLESAFEAVVRTHQMVATVCGEGGMADKAVVLIGRAHGGGRNG